MELKVNKPFTLQVFKKDIKDGCQNNAFKCPVARALKRRIESHELRVDGDFVIVGHPMDQTATRVVVPSWLRRWIEAFDEGNFKIAKPFKKRVKINEDNYLVTVKQTSS